MQRQAEAGPSHAIDGQDGSAAAGSSRAEGSQPPKLRSTEDQDESKPESKPSTQDSSVEARENGQEHAAGANGEEAGGEARFEADGLNRTHSMPGKVEGIATAAEGASPLLDSLDSMLASSSLRYLFQNRHQIQSKKIGLIWNRSSKTANILEN